MTVKVAWVEAEGWVRWTYAVMAFQVKQAVLMRLVPVMEKESTGKGIEAKSEERGRSRAFLLNSQICIELSLRANQNGGRV